MLGQIPDLKLFLELHNVFSTVDSVLILARKLEEIRQVGCRVFSFTILREPLQHAISDLHYFRKAFAEFDDNVTKFLVERVRAWLLQLQ